MMHLERKASASEVEQLCQLFDRFHKTGKGVRQFLSGHLYAGSLRRGDFLLTSGTRCTHIYVIKSGVLRGFIREGEKDITTWITVENEIVAAISSFILQVPTIENIQALEDCELLAISHEDLEALYLSVPTFNIVGRKITELYYTLAENRSFITRMQKAENKYDLFLRHYGHLANRIPQKYIASFLGIATETLSRVRQKARKGSKT
ncbi:Crp/Fnr family transcriptional regulator [Flaviaesturariibacter amylovorans]|uniref:Crp/Fnr family transcriptional regulator n=1 Tax=Flaviaesturariibacter amylovorans TaxID=1084520 RepID=A0ABP8H7C1_9BACT